MRQLPLTEIKSDRITVLMLNGGGQIPYNRFHKAVKLFNGYNFNLVAVELPGHGKSSFDAILSTQEMLDQFRDDFKAIISDYERVALFGFSLGGILSLKAIDFGLTDFEFAIVCGAAIDIEKAQEKVMKEYTTEEFFRGMRWMDHMMEYHKEGWQELLYSVHEMLFVGSEIFSDPDVLGSKSTPIHLIFADHDEVADYKLHQPLAEKYENINVHVLPDSQHFDYFADSWDKMNTVMDKILDNLDNTASK